jgi:hypothetical protein
VPIVFLLAFKSTFYKFCFSFYISLTKTMIELVMCARPSLNALMMQEVSKMLGFVLACKPDLVITEKGLSDFAAHHLQKAGISAIRRLRKTDNNRIARACGATIVNRPEEIKDSDVGTMVRPAQASLTTPAGASQGPVRWDFRCHFCNDLLSTGPSALAVNVNAFRLCLVESTCMRMPIVSAAAALVTTVVCALQSSR